MVAQNQVNNPFIFNFVSHARMKKTFFPFAPFDIFIFRFWPYSLDGRCMWFDTTLIGYIKSGGFRFGFIPQDKDEFIAGYFYHVNNGLRSNIQWLIPLSRCWLHSVRRSEVLLSGQ